MNKKLIVLAVAGVMAAPLAAHAGTEVYGQARMSVDINNNSDKIACGATDCNGNAVSVSSNASRLGFRGDEDLGDGMKFTYQIEQQLNMDTGAAFTSARNTYVGLGGGFGEVRFGKHDTPDKMASAPLDIFADTQADFNSMVGGNVRSDNVIAYISPDMSGFTLAAAYIPSYTNDQLVQTKTEGDQNAVSVAGMYTNGPIYVTAAYEKLAKAPSSSVDGDDATDMKVGGSYNFGQGTKLGLLWEKSQQDNGIAAGTDIDRTAYYIALSHTMDANTFKLAYTNAGKIASGNAGDKTAASQISVGVSHALSKATEVYALYTMISGDDKAVDSFGDPLYHLANADAGLDAGGLVKDVSSFSIGINHAFSSK